MNTTKEHIQNKNQHKNQPTDTKGIPTWAKKYLVAEDIDRIEESIAEAESVTSAEIVPMMILKSSTVGHVPTLLFFIFGLILSLVYHVVGHEWDIWVWVITLISLFFIIQFLSNQFWVCRMLTPKKDQDDQVFQRACLELETSRVRHTKNKTGVLIFISLMERQVVVLADEAIDSQFEQSDWLQVVSKVTTGIKAKKLAKGLVEAVLYCGELLKKDFPIMDDDENELLNHFIIKK